MPQLLGRRLFRAGAGDPDGALSQPPFYLSADFEQHRGFDPAQTDGTRVSSDVPLRVDVPTGVTFVKVSSGGYASYAIDRSGELWAWGDNRSGQLGTGNGTTIATTRSAWVSA